MLKAYREHVAERASLGIPPLPLDARQVADLIELIKNPPNGEDAFLLELLTHRVPPGVDDAAKVKASFLAAVAHGDIQVALVSKAKATELLGTMVGGYNVHPLIELLDDAEVAGVAAEALKKTLLMFDFFNDVATKAKAGNVKAQEVMQSWANAEWFTSRPKVPETITVTVFKVPGETNTDDLSPAPDAWSRPDIPLHYLAMLKNTRPDAAFRPEEDGRRGPMQFIEDLKRKGNLVAYVGDVVGTGSSRKSATNSVIWATGQDIPFVPNKRFGGVTLGGKIAPIFFNTQEDSGSLPIEVDVSRLEMGDVIDVLPYEGRIVRNGETVAQFQLKSDVLLDEVQAGGRINLIIGRSLTAKAREFLGLGASTAFRLPTAPVATNAGFTLAQKMVAHGLLGGFAVAQLEGGKHRQVFGQALLQPARHVQGLRPRQRGHDPVAETAQRRIRLHQVGHLHRQHPGRQRGTHPGRRILQHQAARGRDAEPRRRQQVDVRRGLGRGHLGARADRVEIRQQSGRGQLPQRQRPPGRGRHRARDAARQQPVEQVHEPGTMLDAGIRDHVVHRLGARQQLRGGVVADPLGQQSPAQLVAAADHPQPQAVRQVVAECARRARHAVADGTLAVEHQAVHVEHHRLGPERQRRDAHGGVLPNRTSRSAADRERHWPSARSPMARPPMRSRCSACTWWPIAANIRRTWW